MTPPLPGVLLLDLGRVLFDIDFDRCLTHWTAAARARGQAVDPVALRERFTPDAAFEAHERGELSCEAFFRHLATRLELAIEPEIVREGWNAIFGPDVTGLRERLEALAGHCSLHVLTNTNETHAEHFRHRHARLLAPVETVFASHELGMRKPEPRIYDHVLATLAVAPEDVLFLDDNRENLAGAAARGLRTLHVPGPGRTVAMLDAMLAAHGERGRAPAATAEAAGVPLQD